MMMVSIKGYETVNVAKKLKKDSVIKFCDLLS
jgi:hypothetical protein